jgi:hypothetical protein
LFLDGGVAFAGAGGAGFVDEGGEFFEEAEVVGIALAMVREGEVEGLFFEESEGIGGEGGIAGGGVSAKFGGGFLGVSEVIETEFAGEVAAVGVAHEGHVGDFFFEFGAAKIDDFAARDAVFKPGVDVFELAVGKAEDSADGPAGATTVRGGF